MGVLEAIDPADLLERSVAPSACTRVERLLADSLGARLRPRGEQPVSLAYTYEGVIGDSPAMQAAFTMAARVATTDASVLITGETGTGKEPVRPRAPCNLPRQSGRLVKVDCGAIPDTLIENDLFGHEKGAFTGAATNTPGLFEQADGGTLFLDEVGELSMTPDRMLRCTTTASKRLGGRTRDVNFRLIAATHVNLAQSVARGDFRLDLLHRLKVVQIRLPGLRERGTDDILRLVEHFVEHHGRRHNRPIRQIPQSTQDRLAAWSWPGKARPSHAVESAVVRPDGVRRPTCSARSTPR